MSLAEQKEEIKRLEREYITDVQKHIQDICIEKGVEIIGIPNNMRVDAKSGMIICDVALVKIP